MNIIIKPELTRTYTSDERGNRQVVYFTLTDNIGHSYEMLDDLDALADPQIYLNAHIEEELLFVRQAEYPEHPNFNATQSQSVLEQFEAWVKAGYQVETGKDQDGNAIMKTSRKETWKDRS